MEEERKEVTWMSVPAFGEWEQHKGGAVPDYSLDFSKIRAIRRRSKSHVSIGAEDDLPSAASKEAADMGSGRVEIPDPPRDNRPILPPPVPERSPMRIKKIISYFNCCGHMEA